MSSRTVVLLEDDLDLSAILAQLIGKNNKCLQYHSVDQLVQSKDAVLSSTIIFLDIELGRNCANGIDAFHWLNRSGYKGRIYFLTAHGGNHPAVREALVESYSKVLSKPIAPKTLLNLIASCPA